jgi:hypothetical protein
VRPVFVSFVLPPEDDFANSEGPLLFIVKALGFFGSSFFSSFSSLDSSLTYDSP